MTNRPRFVLVHSPLVPSVTMAPLAEVLEQLGFETVVPELDSTPGHGDLNRRQAAQVERALRYHGRRKAVVVTHSGAGLLSGLIDPAGAAAHVMLDAIFPHRPGSRFDFFDDPATAAEWESLARRHRGRLPASFVHKLGNGITSSALRAAFEALARDVPIELYSARAPIRPGWSVAMPGLYLQWTEPYRHDAQRARDAGFDVVHRPASHLELINDPAGVASQLADFVQLRQIRAR